MTLDIFGPIFEVMWQLFVDYFVPELKYADRITIIYWLMKQARSLVFIHMPEEMETGIVDIIERPMPVQGPAENIDGMEHHPYVSQLDSTYFVFLKMNALYVIWLVVGGLCEWHAIGPLLLNDGGKFYNECYYMFYNGV